MNKRLVISLLPIVFVAGFAGKLVVDAGAFKKFTPHFNGDCREIGGIKGAEDFAHDKHTNRLLISADFRPDGTGEPTPNGALWSLDLNDPSAAPKMLTSPSLPFPFHPHGIGIIREGERLRIFAANHRGSESVIEVFDETPSGLEHSKTIRDVAVVTPNDIAPINFDQFYLTNDHGSRSHLMQSFEAFTRFGRGNLLFYDGQKFQPRIDSLNFANGLEFSPDGKTLYMAVMLGREIRAFTVAGGELTHIKSIALDAAPDNVSVDDEGSLWVGAHPHLFKLKAHSKDHSKKAYAQVLKIQKPLSDSPVIEEVFLDDGNLVSSVSSAVRLGSRLLLGTIFDSKILDCRLR